MRAPLLVAIVLATAAAACASSPAPAAPVASAGPAAPARARQGAPGKETRGPREYHVPVAPGAGEAAVREVFGELGITRLSALGGDVWSVTFARDPGLDRLEALRARDARIRAVQPNLVYKAS